MQSIEDAQECCFSLWDILERCTKYLGIVLCR